MGIEATLGSLALLAALASGIPIYVTLIGVSIILLMIEGGSIGGIGQDILDHMNSATLIAVPFFVIAAGFIQGGGIAKALINMAESWIGRLPGGVALAALFATGLFSAINGSSVATVLAMGTLVVPEMVDRGYKRSFALGLTAAAGTLGILIPPSMPLVVYGLLSEVSIPRLFLAGVVPGALQIFLFSIVIMTLAAREGGQSAPFPGWRNLAEANIKALPALAVPLVVLGGIYGGFVTVTEAAALSAAGSIASEPVRLPFPAAERHSRYTCPGRFTHRSHSSHNCRRRSARRLADAGGACHSSGPDGHGDGAYRYAVPNRHGGDTAGAWYGA
jgi:C4-dicarboxylate transporter DctM subunit